VRIRYGMQLISDNSKLAYFRKVMQPPKSRIQKSRKRPSCSYHRRRFKLIPLRITLKLMELGGTLFLVRLERLVTLLKFVAAEASWTTPQKPWVSSDLFLSTSMPMSWFKTLHSYHRNRRRARRIICPSGVVSEGLSQRPSDPRTFVAVHATSCVNISSQEV